MREIKFSCMYQDKKAETWMELWYTLEDIEERKHLCFLDVLPYKLIAKRLYTGLKDSEGVEIYEGDIVTGLRNGQAILGSLVCHQSSWWVESNQSQGELIPYVNNSRVIHLNGVRSIKVIGNIYQNPELIKQGE